jgi:hypothetical protein
MSRSYKHHPGYKDKVKSEQKCAARKLRHAKDVPSGMAYKKFYDQYSITDYNYYRSAHTRDYWRHTFRISFREFYNLFGRVDYATWIIAHHEYYLDKKLPCWKECVTHSKRNYREFMK